MKSLRNMVEKVITLQQEKSNLPSQNPLQFFIFLFRQKKLPHTVLG